MTENYWTQHATALAEAYVQAAGTIRFEVVTRLLLAQLGPGSKRVVDIGGGFGLQAILLARAGHSVVIVDLDPTMLSVAREKLESEPPEVAARVELVLGSGEEAASLVGTGFDLACCHSVLMYEIEPEPLLTALVGLVRPGGLLSLLCLNQESYAMRSGLQGRWQEAAAILEGRPFEGPYLKSRKHTVEEVSGLLETAGAETKEWHGIGVFTDHQGVVEGREEASQVEWLAASRDPYRRVARCFHLVAERT